MLALISFIVSFLIARAFTTVSPGVVTVVFGFHVHHYWYGLILLALGGWLGINYDEERIDRLAAVIYGAGGGLIGDEAGLLLTLGNYETSVTYTLLVTFLAFVITFIVFKRYSRTIITEIKGFTGSRISFYFGVVLLGVSIAFLAASNSLVAIVSALMSTVACIIIIAIVVYRIRAGRRERATVDNQDPPAN